jgi:hypothetical protein
MNLPFECVGVLPGPWELDLRAFAEKAAGHPWGGGAGEVAAVWGQKEAANSPDQRPPGEQPP